MTASIIFISVTATSSRSTGSLRLILLLLIMGSSCSILNDTEYDVWITERINWQVLAVSVGATAALLSGGIAAFLALGPIEIGLGSALSGMGGVEITTKFKETAAATVQAGLNPSRLTVVREFLESPLKRLAKAFNITEKQAKDLQKYVGDFQAEAKLIRPGEKYTWSGTLSLTKRVHVMNEKLQFDDKACFTVPTDGSEQVYRISEHFTKLDV